jgi:hypothetical protein
VKLLGGAGRPQHGAMVLKLKGTDCLRLQGARGTAIEVLAGRVWVTEDGRGADTFLAPGRCYRVWGDGLVLVSGENAFSEVSIQPG